MTRITDLKTLSITHWEPARRGAYTSVAISQGSGFFAVGDAFGHVLVASSDTKQFIRAHHLDGTVHILYWSQIGSKMFLVAAMKKGSLMVWQEDKNGYTIRLQEQFPYAVNALAFNSQMQLLAISTGLEVRLYENPLQAGSLSVPAKIWSRKVLLPTTASFLKYAYAIGLNFVYWDELLVSYLMGHCVVETTYPYIVHSKSPCRLPSLIFNTFDLHLMDFVGTNNYLTATCGCQIGHEMLPISSTFLAEDIIVTGHKDPLVCIFKLDSHGQGKPIFFEIRGAERGSGVQHVAAAFHKEKPLVIALNSTGVSSKVVFLEGKSATLEVPLKLLGNCLRPTTTNVSSDHDAAEPGLQVASTADAQPSNDHIHGMNQSVSAPPTRMRVQSTLC